MRPSKKSYILRARFCRLRRNSQLLRAPWRPCASARRKPHEIRCGLQPAMNNQLLRPAETIREFRRERAPLNKPETEVPVPAMNSQLLQPAEIIPKFRQLRGRAALQRRVNRRQDECGLQRLRENAISAGCCYVRRPGLASHPEPGQVVGDGGQGKLKSHFLQTPQPKPPHPALFF